MKRIATFLLTALIAVAASAQVIVDEQIVEEEQPRRYSVEVIVFSYTEDVSVGSEIFLPDDPPPEIIEPIPVFGDDTVVEDVASDDEDTEEEEEEEEPLTWVVVAADAQPAADTGEEERPNPFQLVLMMEDEFELGDAIRQFELLDAYETILHVGWTQPAFPEEETPAIELQLLAELPEDLDGTLTLYLSRYLHLVVDLALNAPSEFEEEVIDDDSFFSFGDSQRQYGDEPAAMPIRFRIQENRIFKNGDLRYFDHPQFGVLARVSRVEEPEEEEPEVDDDPEALPLSSR